MFDQLALLLVVVGIESGTLVRHLVQIVPVLLALGLVIRRPEIGSAAAA